MNQERNRPAAAAVHWEASIEDLIYEASVVPDRWPNVLRKFAGAARYKDAVLLAVCGEQVRLRASTPHFETVAIEYFRRFGAGNERTRRLLRARPGGFITDHDVFSVEEMLTEPLYRDMMIPLGYGRGVATAIDMPTGDQVILHAEGEFSTQPLDAGIVQRLDALRPHFARAALLSTRMQFEREKSAVDTFARMGLPAASVGRDGRLRLTSPEFDCETFWSAGLRDRLALRDARADALLRASLAQLGNASAVKSIALVGGAPAVLHVVPVVRAAHDIFPGADALLVATRRKAPAAPATGLLQTLFDLTAAESAVATALATGNSIEQIAREKQRSIETVRSQVKAVLGKTGCARQHEVVALLSALEWPGTRT